MAIAAIFQFTARQLWGYKGGLFYRDRAVVTDRPEDDCASCPQKDECKSAWQRAGGSSVEPVWAKVFVAFVLPLAGFMVALVVLEGIVRGRSANENAIWAISLAGALLAAVIVMLIGRMLLRLFSKGSRKS